VNRIHFKYGRRIYSIKDNRQAPQIRNDLTQEFQPFAGGIGLLGRQSGDVAARARKARYETDANWIDRDCKHDGNRSRSLL
jgi:hypothetical protein